MWIAGLVAAVVAATVVIVDIVLGDAGMVSNGPLAAAHATLDAECGSCHRAVGQVEDARCSRCHEGVEDPEPTYHVSAHVSAQASAHVSDDAPARGTAIAEAPCAGCHREHQGRDALLSLVGNRQCLTCHEELDFERQHPEFRVVAGGAPESEPLLFTHVRHVREVLRRSGGLEDGSGDLVGACSYCHMPEDDGRSFAPIDYRRHCGACHLGTGVATPWLPLSAEVEGAATGTVGVLDLAVLRRLGGEGPLGDLAGIAAADLRTRGDSVRKTRLLHRDPWILANLRYLRRPLYPDADLADLLPAIPVATREGAAGDFREAIEALQRQVDAARAEGVPGEELHAIEQRLERARREVDDPSSALEPAPFLAGLEAIDPGLSQDRKQALLGLVEELTEPCRQCHTITQASIAGVDPDQRVMSRAEFDHGRHALQLGCVDCHDRLPVGDAVLASTDPNVASAADESALVADRAAVVNLPSIATCRTCHSADQAGDRCVSCHRFHPKPGLGRQPELVSDAP